MKKSNIKSFKKILICLKPSETVPGQIGVFAVRNLKKGTVTGELRYLNEDLFFSWRDYKKIDKESREIIPNFCVAIEEGFYAPLDLNYIHLELKCHIF